MGRSIVIEPGFTHEECQMMCDILGAWLLEIPDPRSHLFQLYSFETQRDMLAKLEYARELRGKLGSYCERWELI